MTSILKDKTMDDKVIRSVDYKKSLLKSLETAVLTIQSRLNKSTQSFKARNEKNCNKTLVPA